MIKSASCKWVFLASELTSKAVGKGECSAVIPIRCRKGRVSASATAEEMQVVYEDFQLQNNGLCVAAARSPPWEVYVS